MTKVIAALALSGSLIVIPGMDLGSDGCGVTTHDVVIAEPGGPIFSVGQTEVDTSDCIKKVGG